MALLKEFTTPQGVTATYHKLLKVEISVAEQCVTLVIALYPSAEVRDSGAQALWHEYVRVPFEDFVVDPRQPFYELAATYVNSYLKGAEGG